MATLTFFDITLDAPLTFTTSPPSFVFDTTITITNTLTMVTTVYTVSTIVETSQKAQSQAINPPIHLTPGNYTIVLTFEQAGNVNGTPGPGQVGTVSFFYQKDNGQNILSQRVLSATTSVPPEGNPGFTSEDDELFACLHASSVIITTQGKKFIKDIEVGDKVLTANGEYALVKNVAQCWIKFPGPSHDAVVFEQYSLTEDLPNERFIIDPGHPIKLNSQDDFRCAGEFVTDESLDSGKIYVKKWTDEAIQSPTPSIRWDLVLEDGFDNYIANGVTIKSREDPNNAGYNHSYRNWI